ncbi:uncharacterized protein LOC129597129 isoform X2 [Paramacrobiotus metropolitanus]|nr:uncharacterized protein LOC129597129 isoform X2 [Paramacrobiotus metropolitanus]
MSSTMCAIFLSIVVAVVYCAVQAAAVAHPGMYYNRPSQPAPLTPETGAAKPPVSKEKPVVPYVPVSSWFFPGSRRFVPVSDSSMDDAGFDADADMRNVGTWKRMGHPGRFLGRPTSVAKGDDFIDNDNDAALQNALAAPMARYNFFRLMGQ